MTLIHIDHNPSRRNLLWFGFFLGLFLALIGAAFRWRYGVPTVSMAIWIAAGVVVAFYYLVSPVRKPIFLGWMYATYPLGYVMSYVILGLAYFLVFTPLGLAMRLVGRDPLQRKFDCSARTYWTPHRPPSDSSRYFRQF